MPSEVRVLGATALLTAALVWLAWWLGQHRLEVARQVHGALVSVGEVPRFHLPSLTSGNEPMPTLPTITDAGFSDAGDASDAAIDDGMHGTEAELAAILIPAICNRRRNECMCTEYPSRFAPEEERIGATTCEQDTLRDYRLWWRNNINGAVIMVPEPELTSLLYDNLGCSEVHGEIGEFLRADAVTGEECPSRVSACRDESRCQEGRCVRYQQAGESCWLEGDERLERMSAGDPRPADWAHVNCHERLRCVDERCEVDPAQAWQPVRPRPCRRGTFERVIRWGRPMVTECIPAHAKCTLQDDCGFGYCAGTGGNEQRCVSAEAVVDDPGDHGRIRCGRLWCRRGTACRHDETENTCVPVVGDGELCEHAECGAGTACVSVVPGGGQCIARSCLTSHTFGRIRERVVEPEDTSDAEAMP